MMYDEKGRNLSSIEGIREALLDDPKFIDSIRVAVNTEVQWDATLKKDNSPYIKDNWTDSEIKAFYNNQNGTK